MREKLSQEALDAAIRYCCGDKNGRALLKWMLQKCEVECRVPVSGTLAEAAWVESRRSIGLELRAAIVRNFNRHKLVDIEEERHD